MALEPCVPSSSLLETGKWHQGSVPTGPSACGLTRCPGRCSQRTSVQPSRGRKTRPCFPDRLLPGAGKGAENEAHTARPSGAFHKASKPSGAAALQSPLEEGTGTRVAQDPQHCQPAAGSPSTSAAGSAGFHGRVLWRLQNGLAALTRGAGFRVCAWGSQGRSAGCAVAAGKGLIHGSKVSKIIAHLPRNLPGLTTLQVNVSERSALGSLFSPRHSFICSCILWSWRLKPGSSH